MKNVECVDSVTYKDLLFTYNNSNLFSPKLDIYRLDKESNQYVLFQSILDVDRKLRAAGKIFEINDKIIYPSQNCSVVYGGGVIFHELIINNNSVAFKEISEIGSKFASTTMGKRINGIHTYNVCDNYEIIDIRVSYFGLFGLIKKIIDRLKKQIN